MDRKDKIYEFIKSDLYVPMKANELAIVLGVPKDDYNELLSLLDTLISEGKIYLSNKNKYVLTNNKNIVSGTFICNSARGFGFVRPENGDSDIFVPSSKFNGALDGDKVLVIIEQQENENKKREGRIFKITYRANRKIVGVVTSKKAKGFVIRPDKAEITSNIFVKSENANEAQIGDRVLVNISEFSNKYLIGKIELVLGNKDEISSCLKGLLAQKNISKDFPEPVKAYAEGIADRVTDAETVGREDFRNKLIFTIDGDDSKDFDDAVSLEYNNENHMMLGVHIADVSHYVTENSIIDKEAFKRGTSIYLPHMVIPMLPEKLSNNICSLNPGVDRLTLSIIIEFDSNANVISHKIVNSVIRSYARLTYDNVNKLLEGCDDLPAEYSDLAETLERMNELSKALIKKRQERGAIDFDFPETKVICDDSINPVDVVFEERGDSHKMIESFMLIANELVAETAHWSELPFVYRIHPSPDNAKLTEFNNFIKNFGYSIKGKIDSETIHPKALQEIAESVKNTPEELIISKMMLRSMMKASYSESNEGHFGLAAGFYCHFTSPIRRYPDLIVHRIIKEFISGKLTKDKQIHYEKIMNEIATHSSECETDAETLERDATDILKAAYMRNYLGCTFKAIVSSVTSFGIFAMLENSCEGLIRYETMQEDYFEYDELKHLAYGIRTNAIYSIGDEIEITVVGADMLSGRIDFVLADDYNHNSIAKLNKRNRNIKNTNSNTKNKRKHKRRKYVR